MDLKVLAVAAGALAVTWSPPARAAVNLATNGDFETGLTDWTVTGAVTAPTSDDYIPCCSPAHADGVNHFAAFGVGGAGGLQSLSQEITDVAGATYTLRFDLGAFANTGLSLSSPFHAAAGGASQDYTVVSDDDAATTFHAQSFSFTGHGADSVSFSVTAGFQDAIDEVVDNISVTRAAPLGSAAPEPGAWALMLVGFGLAGAAVRRARTARA